MWINYSAIGERLHHVEFEFALLVFFPLLPETFSRLAHRDEKFLELFLIYSSEKIKFKKKGNGEVLSTNLHICSKLFFAAPFPINLTFLLSWGMWRKLNSLFSTSSWHSLRFIFTHMKCFDSFFKCTNPSSSSWKVHLEIYTPIFLHKEFSEFWRLALCVYHLELFSRQELNFCITLKKKLLWKLLT